MKKVELTELLSHFDFYIDEDSKEIHISSSDNYVINMQLNNHASLSVDGDMFINYNGKIYLGSMCHGESIGMTLDEIRKECELRYQERAKEIEDLMKIQYHPQIDSPYPTELCNTCNV